MPANKERIQRVKRKALEYDMNYSGCSQSVLGALQEEFGIGDNESFKAATVLSEGVARQGETCGAIIGALLALGLLIGRKSIEDVEAYRAMMNPSIEIRDKFKEELKNQFGFKEAPTSTLCREIQEKVLGRSFNLNDEEDYQAFLAAGGHSDHGCPKVCGIGAQVAAEKILELI
jgi:C_GCAxxG_C_C family probable redox protein